MVDRRAEEEPVLRSLILALAAGGCSVVSSSVAPARPVTLIAIHMVSPRAGWGQSAHALLRTLDGGRHWTAVKVPDRPGSLFDVALAVHDVNTAWLVSPLNVKQGPPLSVVLSTHDGGGSWSRSNVIRGWAFDAAAFSWLTARRGWLLTGEGGAAGSTPTDVYRTEDGGLHWQLLAYNHLLKGSPAALGSCDGFTGISFRTAEDGWAAGSCGAAPQILMLYRTLDGGRRWHSQRLAPPGNHRFVGWSLSPPTFFGKTGILPALVSLRSLALYVTHDGGASWLPTRPVPDRDLTGPHVFAVDPRHVWALAGTTLYFTPDGGHSWRVLARRLPLPGPNPLDFVDSRTGFGLPGYAGDRHPYLLETDDGGRTWRRLATSIG